MIFTHIRTFTHAFLLCSLVFLSSLAYADTYPIHKKFDKKIKKTLLYIKTSKHHIIPLIKDHPTLGPSSQSDNNYGWTFLEGNAWLTSKQVSIVLHDDYNEIAFGQLNENDIVVVYNQQKEITYTLTACFSQNNSTTCSHLKQPSMFLFVIRPEKILLNPDIIKFYRSKNKALLTILP